MPLNMQICRKRALNFKTLTKTRTNPHQRKLGGKGLGRDDAFAFGVEWSQVEYVSCVALFVAKFSAQLEKFHENVSHSMGKSGS